MHKPLPFLAAAFCLSVAGLAGIAGCKRSSSVEGSAHKTASSPAPPRQEIQFESVAEESGLHYRWPRQPRPLRNLEAFGTGCAFLDYDNDGWQDILLVGKPDAALFRNTRDGRFENTTATTALAAHQGDWKGCAVGDYDGDGFLDLLLTGYHRLALLKNEGGKRWKDVTRNAGLDSRDRGHWGSSAGFMDLDGNGTLDLVVGHYVIFGPKEKQYCDFGDGVKSGCPPQQYRPEFTELWQNLGGGKFKEVTASSGMKKTNGKALVLAFADINDDGRTDFYIGNDGTPAELMLNQGAMRFRNAGVKSGAAFGTREGRAMAAMGADWQDYDGDGHLDLAVSGFSNESYSLLRNLGQGMFEQNSDVTGIAAPTLLPLGFGTKWLDADNDSWPDLVFANGHVYDKASQINSVLQFRQPLILLHNQAGYLDARVFKDIAPNLGGAFTKPILGRGLATGDYDNDGRMDILVVDYEGEPLLLHNRSQTANHWIMLDLRGAGSNRFAYGAKVVAKAGKRTWVGVVSPASSYLSSSDRRLHFGLGRTQVLDSVTISWPGGKSQKLQGVRADRIVVVKEGKGIVNG